MLSYLVHSSLSFNGFVTTGLVFLWLINLLFGPISREMVMYGHIKLLS